MRYNIARGVTKYAMLASAVCKSAFQSETDAALAVADAVAELCADVGLPTRLGELGVTADMASVLSAASMGSSMSKNPVAITQEECAKFILSLI